MPEKTAYMLAAHTPKTVCFFVGFLERNMAVNPAKFIREVRQEMNKVTWPTRQETTISTIMVLVLAVIAAIFFLLVDGILATGVQWILGLGQ
jgi:preprotein translocase subunit SecE